MSQELYNTFIHNRRQKRLVDVSYSYFMKIWRRNRSTLKAKSGTEFMKCYECTQYKTALYGTPGIRATVDGAAREVAEEKYRAHLKVTTGSMQSAVGASKFLLGHFNYKHPF